jgi:hypothetical protein
VGGVERIISDISGRHPQDGDACGFGYLALYAVEMRIDGFGFPPCISEYRIVDAGKNSLGGKSE